jgi:hypothetical protein
MAALKLLGFGACIYLFCPWPLMALSGTEWRRIMIIGESDTRAITSRNARGLLATCTSCSSNRIIEELWSKPLIEHAD